LQLGEKIFNGIQPTAVPWCEYEAYPVAFLFKEGFPGLHVPEYPVLPFFAEVPVKACFFRHPPDKAFGFMGIELIGKEHHLLCFRVSLCGFLTKLKEVPFVACLSVSGMHHLPRCHIFGCDQGERSVTGVFHLPPARLSFTARGRNT